MLFGSVPGTMAPEDTTCRRKQTSESIIRNRDMIKFSIHAWQCGLHSATRAVQWQTGPSLYPPSVARGRKSVFCVHGGRDVGAGPPALFKTHTKRQVQTPNKTWVLKRYVGWGNMGTRVPRVSLAFFQIESECRGSCGVHDLG